MIKFDSSEVQWQKPWLAVSTDVAQHAESELRREMSAGHVLSGRSVAAVGRRQDCDDILFYLGDTPPMFAVVHLTHSKETSPEWPRTILFDSFDAWFQQCMISDAKEFSS